MSWLGLAICLCAGYLLGSVPTGYLVARARGVDLRRLGSGNIGATNAFRVLGRGPGLVVLVGDVLKGYLAPTVACAAVAALWRRWDLAGFDVGAARVWAGLGAVLGHTYTCWLGFRGGKGIATSAGVFLALAPVAVAVALAGWVAMLLAFRYVSLASVTAAVLLPATVWLMQDQRLLAWVTTGVGVIAILRHRDNLRRLLQGTEPRFRWRKEVGS